MAQVYICEIIVTIAQGKNKKVLYTVSNLEDKKWEEFEKVSGKIKNNYQSRYEGENL